jgi:hypothetical protein
LYALYLDFDFILSPLCARHPRLQRLSRRLAYGGVGPEAQATGSLPARSIRLVGIQQRIIPFYAIAFRYSYLASVSMVDGMGTFCISRSIGGS